MHREACRRPVEAPFASTSGHCHTAILLAVETLLRMMSYRPTLCHRETRHSLQKCTWLARPRHRRILSSQPILSPLQSQIRSEVRCKEHEDRKGQQQSWQIGLWWFAILCLYLLASGFLPCTARNDFCHFFCVYCDLSTVRYLPHHC